MNHIGLRIKKLRILANASQSEIARQVGISQQAYSKLERGESHSEQTLLKIAKVFHTSLDYLSYGNAINYDLISIINIQDSDEIISVYNPNLIDLKAVYVDCQNDNLLEIVNKGVSSVVAVFDINDAGNFNGLDIVIIKSINNDDRSVKRLIKYDGKNYLQPLDKSFPSVQFDESKHFIEGKIKQFQTNLSGGPGLIPTQID